MKIFYYIKRFWEIPGIEKQLLIKALILNILYSLIVHIFPLKSYSFLLTSCNTKNIIFKNKEKTFFLIRKTINRTSIILPWHTGCLVKSFTFKHLANNFGISCTVAIEVFKGSSNIINAHAYILSENAPVYLFRKSHSNHILFKGEIK